MNGPDGDSSHDDMRALFGDYARGRLDDWQRGVVDQHVYWCLDCRTALRASLQPDPSPEPDEGATAPQRRWWWPRR